MNQQEVFQATFNAFKDYDMRLGIENLRNDLKHRFESIPSSDLCYKMKSVIIKHVWLLSKMRNKIYVFIPRFYS